MFGAGKSFNEVRKSDFTPHPPPVGGWVGWSVASFGDMCGVDPGYCALSVGIIWALYEYLGSLSGFETM